MSNVAATASDVIAAFRELPKKERNEVLIRITEDQSIREDLIDLAIYAETRNEPVEPFEDYVASRRERMTNQQSP